MIIDLHRLPIFVITKIISLLFYFIFRQNRNFSEEIDRRLVSYIARANAARKMKDPILLLLIEIDDCSLTTDDGVLLLVNNSVSTFW